MSTAINPQAIIDRSLGFIKLDDATYEDVERDTTATSQAAVVVVVASLASAIGALGEGGTGFISALFVGIISWVIVSYVIFFIGTRLLASASTEADLGQLLRTVGFAQVAGVLGILGSIPVLGGLAVTVAFVWGIVMTIKAVRHALEMSQTRAIVTSVAGWLIAGIIASIIFRILGVDVGVAG